MAEIKWRFSGVPGAHQSLEGMPDLQGFVHAFSTRLGGCSNPPYDSLNLGSAGGDDPLAVEQNRRLFLGALEQPGSHLHTLKQVHSCDVLLIQGQRLGAEQPPQGDAQMTESPNVLLGVLTADCYPILLADTRRKVVAAVHAGWRGTAGGIVSRTLERMSQHWHCQAQDLVALVGPGIGSCCYQVGPDVYESFLKEQPSGAAWFVSDSSPGAHSGPRWRLDLLSANRAQLEAGGLQLQRIFWLGECTACRSELYYSYRRDGAATGRMLSVIGVADSNGRA